MSEWADSSLDDLEEAEDSLDDEADSLEESIAQLTGAARTIGSVLTSGVDTIAEVVRLDPESRCCGRRLEHLRSAAGGDELDEHHGLDPDRAPGARRHRLHRARRTLRRDRARAVGRCRHARPRLRVRARSGRAADQRDADHHRGRSRPQRRCRRPAAIDYMVQIASKALRARPKALNFVAPVRLVRADDPDGQRATRSSRSSR